MIKIQSMSAMNAINNGLNVFFRPTEDEFLENLLQASVTLQEKLSKVIDFLADQKLCQL